MASGEYLFLSYLCIWLSHLSAQDKLHHRAHSIERIKVSMAIPLHNSAVPGCHPSRGNVFCPGVAQIPRDDQGKLHPSTLFSLFQHFTWQKYDAALQCLSRLRNLPEDHEYVQWEISQIRKQCDSDDRIRGDASSLQLFKQLFQSRDHRKRLGLGMGLLVRALDLF